MVVPSTLFEEFGFNYIGPIDGHDLDSLIPTLKNIRELKGPQFLHVVTKKGQGYKLAEADPVLYHGAGQVRSRRRHQEIERRQADLHAGVRRLAVRHGAARHAPGRHHAGDARRLGPGALRRRNIRERYFDVGIAEQHAVTFAAGLACEGMKPVVAIYSTFLQRAYDQLIHDVCIQNLPVVFALDRAGLVGADGATHNGAFDLAYLRCIPNMMVMTPARRERVPADAVHGVPARSAGGGALSARQRARARRSARRCRRCRWQGRSAARRAQGGVAILAFGSMLQPALEAGEELDATVANMRFVKPLDAALVAELARDARTAGHGGGERGDGRRRAARWPRRSPRAASPRRCCTWACRTASSITAIRRSCSRRSAWIGRASSPPVRARARSVEHAKACPRRCGRR